jgi:hypothetical protein
MEDNVGYPIQSRQNVTNAIFGKDGIVYSTDIDIYNTRVNRLRQEINKLDEKENGKCFQTYFDQKLLPLLEKHVIEPTRTGKITANWTNNNSESANHVLKSAVSWKYQDLPKFINTLYDIVRGEQLERCRAVRNTGNFKLADMFLHHEITLDKWTDISEEQRERRLCRFLSDSGKANPNAVISTDGQRSVIIPASAGKKPNQKKRKRAERSNAPCAKRKLSTVGKGQHHAGPSSSADC